MKLKLKFLFRSHQSLRSKLINNDNCTSFNDLSNDLLLEIFDYLSYNDILQSFKNLNIYLNELIKNYPHCIDFQIHKEYPNYIRSLKLSRNNHLLNFYSLKSSQLISLRAITFGNLRAQDIINVLNSIPYKQIEYIYLGVCAFDKIPSTIKMLSTIQSSILSLSEYRLKQCHLKEKFSVIINDLPEKLFSLEYLQIVACHDLFLISQLISRTPNLKYLHISTIDIHQNPFISNIFHLTCLSIRPHTDCTVKELTIFLRKSCSNLKKLIVELYTYCSKQPCLLVNKYQWLTIFPYRLKYFHFKSVINPSIHLVHMINDNNQFKSPLKENLLLIFSDIQEHYCQILIDPPLISTWIKDD